MHFWCSTLQMQVVTSIPELLVEVASWEDQLCVIERTMNEPLQNFQVKILRHLITCQSCNLPGISLLKTVSSFPYCNWQVNSVNIFLLILVYICLWRRWDLCCFWGLWPFFIAYDLYWSCLQYNNSFFYVFLKNLNY